MYTFSMQKSRWWDWLSVMLLFILAETVTSRLIATDWTPFLYLIRTITFIGCLIGITMGYSRFQPGLTRWLTFLYMLILLPLQGIRMIDQQVVLEEQLRNMGGRVLASLGNFFARQPVEDPIFFVALMSIVFWVIGSWAGFSLIRNRNYLGAVLPFATGLLVIQYYDNANSKHLWFMAFFIFMALILLGRLNYLQHMESWQARQVFLSQDNRVDLTNSMLLAAGLIILVSWSVPASLSSLNSAVERWNQMTKPWREFSQKLDNAFDALKSTGGGVRRVDFFSSELSLGTGFSLSDVVMFTVEAPEIPDEDNPPRFYWQGRSYDRYENGNWSTTQTTQTKFLPSSNTLVVSNTSGQPRFRFNFFTSDNPLSLLYAPAQPVWVSRSSSILLANTDNGEDISAWFASPMLQAGESYQVEAAISNPGVNELQNAGANYPAWVTEKYLQVPENFSPRIRDLALQVTEGAQTPYDRALSITQYLRGQIEYSDTVEKAPDNKDPLEWVLFDYKKGYCVYYATAETLMLRSLGIPARMAVGFAQGQYSADENLYVVRKLDAHAWPEVYFPNIGWVEFEPTGNQPELDRPTPEEDNANPAALPTLSALENQSLTDEQLIEEKNIAANTDVSFSLRLYLIPLFIILATLTVYFGRKYSVPANIPTLLRSAYERNNIQAPAWILNWEQWINISPIERSFESINFSLRLLDTPLPIHATPIERAQGLIQILPKVENEVNTLLDEHQTSLYTSRQADVIRARRAAFTIRWQALLERVRYLLEGKPDETP
jgi:transglutaminase-like putative cysteine protease